MYSRNIRFAVISCFCCVLVLMPWLASLAGESESVEAKIARAVSAAPVEISDDATVMDVDGTVLREGSNGWTCLPGVSLMPGDTHPMCNDAIWMQFLQAAAEGQPFTVDAIGYSYMLMGDALVNNDDPGASDPNDGGVWIEEGPHLMLLMPQAMLEAVNRDPYAGGPYVMWGDTPLAHVMVPVASKPE